MAMIKLPKKLQPIKSMLNDCVRTVSKFLATLFTKVSTGPNVFYKKYGKRGPFS